MDFSAMIDTTVADGGAGATTTAVAMPKVATLENKARLKCAGVRVGFQKMPNHKVGPSLNKRKSLSLK
jgi:hypothetical protein